MDLCHMSPISFSPHVSSHCLLPATEEKKNAWIYHFFKEKLKKKIGRFFFWPTRGFTVSIQPKMKRSINGNSSLLGSVTHRVTPQQLSIVGYSVLSQHFSENSTFCFCLWESGCSAQNHRPDTSHSGIRFFFLIKKEICFLLCSFF